MNQVNEITPKQVEEQMEKDDNMVIIDVREDEEVAQGMIEDARHIALQHIPYSIHELDKDKHYVLVCRSGGRSNTAAEYMNEHGFRVSNMVGGMLEWEGEVIF